MTLGDPAPNVFRFAADLSQQVAGLGTYAFEDLGWRHAVVVAEDDEAGWGGAAAFLAEFCALGGRASQFQMSPDLQPPSVPDADGVAVFFTPFGKTPEALAASPVVDCRWSRPLVGSRRMERPEQPHRAA